MEVLAEGVHYLLTSYNEKSICLNPLWTLDRYQDVTKF